MPAMKPWIGYAWAIGAAVIATLVGLAIAPRFDLVNVAMIYLLAVVLVALRFTRGAAAVASFVCVAAFDFAFVPPQGAFTVDDIQYVLTFAIMLGVGLVISHFAQGARQQAAEQARLVLEAETERIRS